MQPSITQQVANLNANTLEVILTVVARGLGRQRSEVKPEHRLKADFGCDPHNFARDFEHTARLIAEQLGIKFSDTRVLHLVNEDTTLAQLAESIVKEITVGELMIRFDIEFTQEEVDRLLGMSLVDLIAISDCLAGLHAINGRLVEIRAIHGCMADLRVLRAYKREQELREKQLREKQRAAFFALAYPSAHSWNKELPVFGLLAAWIVLVIAMTAHSQIVVWWALGGFGTAFFLAAEKPWHSWVRLTLRWGITAMSLVALGAAAARDFHLIDGASELAGPRGLANNFHSLPYLLVVVVSPVVGWVMSRVGCRVSVS